MPMQPIGGPLDFQQGPLGAPIQMPAPQPKKAGMFGAGKGNIGMAIQAALYGALAARGNPVGAYGLQAMQQKQQQALEEAKYSRQREDGFQDWVRKQAWELANKPQSAGQPHYFEDNAGNQWAIGADGQPKMVHKDDLPYKFVPNGMGGVVPVNLQALMGGQGGAPAPQGVTFTPIDEGGAGSPAPRPFR